MIVARIVAGLGLIVAASAGAVAQNFRELLPGRWLKTNVVEWRAAPTINQIIGLAFGPVNASGAGDGEMTLRAPNLQTGTFPVRYQLSGNPRAGYTIVLSFRVEDGRPNRVEFTVRALSPTNMTLEYAGHYSAVIATRTAHFEKSR